MQSTARQESPQSHKRLICYPSIGILPNQVLEPQNSVEESHTCTCNNMLNCSISGMNDFKNILSATTLLLPDTQITMSKGYNDLRKYSVDNIHALQEWPGNKPRYNRVHTGAIHAINTMRNAAIKMGLESLKSFELYIEFEIMNCIL